LPVAAPAHPYHKMRLSAPSRFSVQTDKDANAKLLVSIRLILCHSSPLQSCCQLTIHQYPMGDPHFCDEKRKYHFSRQPPAPVPAVVPAAVVPSLANYIKTMVLCFLLKHSHQHILLKVWGIFIEVGQRIQSLSWVVARQSRDTTFQNTGK